MQTTLSYFKNINHDYERRENKKITHYKSGVSFKKHRNVDEKKKVISYYTKAKKHCQNGDYESALDCCSQCLKINPKFHKAYNIKALISFKRGDYGKALKLYSKSISITKNNYTALFGKARILAALFERNMEDFSPQQWDSRLNEVIYFLNRSAVYNVEVYLIKAEFLNNLKLYDMAIHACDEFLDRTSTIHAKYFRACLLKAYAVKSAGDYRWAIDIYTGLRSDGYKSMNIYFYLGELYFITGEYEKSYEMFEEYLYYDGENIDALMYFAQSSVEIFEFDRAIESYERILEIDSSFYNALIFKFELLCKLTRFDEALDVFAEIPYGEIPECYADLSDYAFAHLDDDCYSGIYSVSLVNGCYEFFYIRNGKFKVFNANNKAYLKYFITRIGHIWCLI